MKLKAEEENQQNENNSKKIRLFSANEFRKKLFTTDCEKVLKEFITLIESNEDVIFEYLESGGSCIELLQILESEITIHPTIVLDVVNKVLLKISLYYEGYHSSAHEMCHYFLNNYVLLINKMLGLSSSTKERKMVLKILTTIVSFSASVAKDILIHVNLNPANIELLTKHSNEVDSVRDVFIHFVTAYLAESYPFVSVLLEKKALLSNVIKGLQFDLSDTVCLLLNMLKDKLLLNPHVSKTFKMKIFCTPIVRHIINLYNWKGPGNFDPKKVKKSVSVDEYQKSKVNESVHKFLLVLCTSHKYGVIFKDNNMGLGKKHQNALMYTVLESLERPWEHSYACELVTKICGACPDLTKTIWTNLKPFLEPRVTTKWLNAVKFVKILLNELQPSCIDFCVEDLTVYQLGQIIQFLVAPTYILKTIIPENNEFKQATIKYHILTLLKEMLVSLDIYLDASINWIDDDKFVVLKNLVKEHIAKNFPQAIDILKNWNQIDDDSSTEFEKFTAIDNLEIIFEIFNMYKKMCPQLLETLVLEVDLNNFIKTFDEICVENEGKTTLFIKIIDLLLSLESKLFMPKNDTFASILPLLLKFYYEKKDLLTKQVLRRLFKITEIFEGCEVEIDIWLNALFALENVNDYVTQYLVTVLQITSNNLHEYLEKLAIKANLDNCDLLFDFDDILETLNFEETSHSRIKKNHLSPLILGALETEKSSKLIKVYLNVVLINLFHLQTYPEVFMNILEEHQNKVSKNVMNYISSWRGDVVALEKSKHISTFEYLSKIILFGGTDTLEMVVDDYPDMKFDLMYMIVFYITKLEYLNKLQESHINNCLKIIKNLVKNYENETNEKYLKIVFTNPMLLQSFNILQKNKSLCGRFVKEFMKYFKEYQLEIYLKDFRQKILGSILKLLKKPKKAEIIDRPDLIEVIKTFGFNYKQCYEILCALTALEEDLFVTNENNVTVFYDLAVYTLNRITSLSKINTEEKVLSNEIIKKIDSTLSFLIQKSLDVSELSKVFFDFLTQFPHFLEYTSSELLSSILTSKEYCKEKSMLATILLRKNVNLNVFKENIQNICNTKGLILPLLQVLVAKNVNNDILEIVYQHFQISIQKALQKPHKAGINFEKYSDGVLYLIKEFMTTDNCKIYLDKIHKYETTELFHVAALKIIFQKYLNENVNEKYVHNSILIFIHLGVSLFKKKTKTEEDWLQVEKVSNTINCYLKFLQTNCKNSLDSFICENETLKLYCKMCLKFGLTGKPVLLEVLTSFCSFMNLPDEEAELLLEMVLSHSEFLEVVLNDGRPCKTEVFNLILMIAQRWPKTMNKNHVSLFLASYRATWTNSDKIILSLLKLYENAAAQTFFYDFKPFLWGRSAANLYSIRSNMHNALWRQPKMGDVLDILQESWILSTIKNYPLRASNEIQSVQKNFDNVYNFEFLLPLFASLLAPENSVQAFRFIRSGALSLTVSALSSETEEIRSTACFVLSRFYYHLDCTQKFKDKSLWLRFIEALCKGFAVEEQFKLNNFASIFFARMALILTEPMNLMYVPLSQYLTAKSILNLNSIPELYTFLHPPNINYKEHQEFILEIIRDGLRTNNDLEVALKSMSLKLILELLTSKLSDLNTKVLILEVLNNFCKLPKGTNYLCNKHAMLSFLYNIIFNLNNFGMQLLSPVIQIVNTLIKNNGNIIDVTIISCIINHVMDKYCNVIKDNELYLLLDAISGLIDIKNSFLSENLLKQIIVRTQSRDCEYLLKYGAKYTCTLNDDLKDIRNYVKHLTIKWLNINH